MSKIIYIAGYGSTINSSLVSILRDTYKAENLLLIYDYDFANPNKVIEDIDAKIKNFVEIDRGRFVDEECIIIGQSYGGYFANLFAERYGIPAFLVNPQIRPELSNNLTKNADLRDIPVSTDDRKTFKKLYLSTEDVIVRNEWVEEFFPNRPKKYLVGEGHKIKNIEPLLSDVNNYIYNIQDTF